ncbi:MAG: DNA double-strand break repair protein Mre11 [Halovenus sp.]
MTRLVHTGDTHLGYGQYHLPERREDFQAAFEQVLEDAVAEDVDAVVHAGDLFHDRQPSLSDVLGAVSALERLNAAGIPFLAVVGNHESKRDAQWLDLFETMGLATRLGPDPTTVGDVAVYGLDFVPRAQREDLTYAFEPHDADTAVLVSHGLFEPFAHGDWDVREILRASPVAFDAVLLGDDHEPGTKRLEEPHDVWLTYCGSTERASAAETEPRGYNIVQFEDGVDIRRKGLETRDFVFVDVDLGESEGSDRVREQVGQHDLTDAVVIVKIRGDGEPVMPATIEAFATDRGALTARVTDEREQPEDGEIEVSFADPDEAVRERVGDLGLSRAARDLDETIRASTVADSNVADVAATRVAELVEEGNASAFQPAADSDGADSTPQADRDAAGSDEGQVSMEDYL